MPHPDTSRAEALDALLADKRKHEGYLARLEERRATTPAHLFDRLYAEYHGRLAALRERAQAEAAALADGLAEDEAAVVEVEARLQGITEERSEGELRAAVGEYDPRSWAKKLAALNATISAIESERDARLAALEHRRALLAEASGAMTPSAIPELPVVPPPQVLPVTPAPPRVDRADEPFADFPPIAAGPERAVAPDAGLQVESAPVSAGDPVPPAAADQDAAKSLVCGACGTPNFPTEWYCERCGGELAAV
jgi:hypothetical protein